MRICYGRDSIIALKFLMKYFFMKDGSINDKTDEVISCNGSFMECIETPMLSVFSQLTLNSSPPIVAYMHQWTGPALVQVMACCLFRAKPLSKLMLGYCQLDP